MQINKSAPPVAPAASNGSSSLYGASKPEEGGRLASRPSAVSAKVDPEPTRIHEVPAQTSETARNDIGMTSNVLPMKRGAQRRQNAHLIPYARLRELLGFNPDAAQPVLLSPEDLQQVVRLLLRAVHVDEDWYLRQHPDVKEAVAKGVFRSAKHHFIESGYFEGRRPARVIVDEEWYGRAYPDVSESIEFGELASCQEHFDRYGESEGRLPSED
jgi:hypothetical protein